MKLKNLVLFNLFVNLFYFTIIQIVLLNNEFKNIVFSLSDSHEYKEFGEWLINHNKGYCSQVRPFLYPIISQTFCYFFGVLGIWMMQYICYLISINLLLISIFKTTNNYLFSYTGGLLLATNLTFITLTLEGMTEVSVILLLSILIYYVTNILNKKLDYKAALFMLLLFALLTVVKPLFLNLTLGWMLLIIILFHKDFMNLKKVVFFMVCLSPLFIQAAIMKINHNSFFISKIGAITYRDYYFRKLYADVNHIPFNMSTGPSEIDLKYLKEQTQTSNASDILSYMSKHPLNAVSNYFEIFYDNLTASSTIVSAFQVKEISRIPKTTNLIYAFFHLTFLIIILTNLK